MELKDIFKNAYGVVTVRVEGFFIERFITLCKNNNIEIRNLRNINSASIEFEIAIANFKKIGKFLRKSKCKCYIVNKKGLYFLKHKYRKRKIFFIMTLAIIISLIILSTFIWKIDITGNNVLSNEYILDGLKKSGIYAGRSHLFIDKIALVNEIRVNIPEISWVGIEINGITINVEIAEKKPEAIAENSNIPKHVIAKKTGIISKIIAENGTAVYKQGEYIEEGQIAIAGIIEDKYFPAKFVSAKGILRANVEYEKELTVSFENVEKKYLNKKYYLIGFNINNNEIMLNYLPKDKKYDITKKENKFSLFGNNLSFNIYTAENYIEEKKLYSYDEAKDIVTKLMNEEINKDLAKDSTITEKKEEFITIDGGIKLKVRYTIEEDIAEQVVFDVY